MTIKERLHKLVDELPEAEAAAAHRYLQYLLTLATHPAVRATLDAPEDEDELSDRGRRAIEEGFTDLAAGRTMRDEDVRRIARGD